MPRYEIQATTSTPKVDSGERAYEVERLVLFTSDDLDETAEEWERLRRTWNPWFTARMVDHGSPLDDKVEEQEWDLHTGEWESYEE